jgi:hypothetical protein
MKGAQRADLFGPVQRSLWTRLITLGIGLAADQGKCSSNRQEAARRKLKRHSGNLSALKAR